jgi:signal transduction histidine kinase
VNRSRRWLASYGIDALIVAMAVVSAIGTAQRDDAEVPSGVGLWLEVAAIAGVLLVLLLRRRLPFAAPASLWLWAAALSFVDGEIITSQPAVFVAGLGAAGLLGNQRNAAQARLGLAIVLGGSAIVVYNNPTLQPGSVVFIPLQFALAWLVGFALRERTARTEAAEERAARAERDREAAARIAVAEERARIARELHDVVAHAVSVMVLQVGAVRHRMAEDDTENSDALKNVETAGRTALAEMRRLLGAMRASDEPGELTPHPGLGDLDALVDDVRAAGLEVRLHLQGEPVDLSPGLDLSAYRIVQEALTNTLKHAHASRADVDVRYGTRDLDLEVRDDGRGSARSDGLSDAMGHGLVGIAERVKIYGGDLSAGSSATGGFTVHVHLPLESEES